MVGLQIDYDESIPLAGLSPDLQSHYQVQSHQSSQLELLGSSTLMDAYYDVFLRTCRDWTPALASLRHGFITQGSVLGFTTALYVEAPLVACLDGTILVNGIVIVARIPVDG